MNIDDPKLTAYAFDELDPAERAEIEQMLRDDPAVVAELEATRAFAAQLRTRLQSERAEGLHPAQRAEVLASVPEPPRNVVTFSRRAAAWSALAASVIIGVGVALLFPAINRLEERRPAGAFHSARAPLRPITDGSQVRVELTAETDSITAPEPTPSPGVVEHNLAVNEPLPSVSAITRSQPVATPLPRPASPIGPLAMADPLSSAPSPRGAPAPVPLAEMPAKLTPFSATLAKAKPFPGKAASFKMAALSAGVKSISRDDGEADRSYRGRYRFVDDLSDRPDSDPSTAESYESVTDNPFTKPTDAPLSTFSIDVDTASYANVRRFLNGNSLPPKAAVRIEELVNYFHYDYPQPNGDTPFSSAMEISSCPWAPEHRLLRVALHGRDIARAARPASNLIFLIDVSGSMQPENKLPLLKRSLALMVDQLGERDQVGIVVYAGAAGCVLEPPTARTKSARRSIVWKAAGPRTAAPDSSSPTNSPRSTSSKAARTA